MDSSKKLPTWGGPWEGVKIVKSLPTSSLDGPPIVAAVSSTMLLCKYGTTKHMYTGCTIPDLKLLHISPKSCIDKTILVTYLPTFNRTKICATELWCMGCTPNTRKLQLVKEWVAKSRPSFCKPCTYCPFSNLLANYLHTTIKIHIWEKFANVNILLWTLGNSFFH